MEQFEVEFINDLKRLVLTRQDVYNKLEVTQPTLKSRLQNPETFTIREIKILKELGFTLNHLGI
jgi:hypothetical protein